MPTYLGIGAARSGTTWLSAVLSAHPGVFVTDPKELHFWSDSVRSRDLDWYRSHFVAAAGYPVRGEITPAYSRLPVPVIRAMARLLPDVRLVLLIRDPVERIWSHVTRYYYRHRVPVDQLLPMRHYIRRAERLTTVLATDYERMIDAWTAVYGQEALLVGLYDDLTRDPAGLVRDVLRHIGGDPAWPVPADLLAATVNPKPQGTVAIPAYCRWYLARGWEEPMRRLNERLGGRISHWVEGLETTSLDRQWWPVRRVLDRALIALPEHVAGRVKYEVVGRQLVRGIGRLSAPATPAPR